ncbi:hypothetical protein NMG60_11018417 [Bertholletia excelsa]
METPCSSSYFANLNLLVEESRSTEWTKEENKRFERALAIFDDKCPDRWLKVAEMIPGKSVSDVMRQYMELEADVSDIEAGLVPIPGYLASSFTLEMGENRGFEALRKRPLGGRSSDQERKKGIPWTEDEHRRFLMGLQKHGKGDWRNISRNFVISKTPTQVASHAQKYFIRQNSGGKDKRRPSIHDITTVHLSDITATTTEPGSCGPAALDRSSLLTASLQKNNAISPKVVLNWSQSSDNALMVYDSTRASPFLQYPHEIASHSLNSWFQIQPTKYQIHG